MLRTIKQIIFSTLLVALFVLTHLMTSAHQIKPDFTSDEFDLYEGRDYHLFITEPVFVSENIVRFYWGLEFLDGVDAGIRIALVNPLADEIGVGSFSDLHQETTKQDIICSFSKTIITWDAQVCGESGSHALTYFNKAYKADRVTYVSYIDISKKKNHQEGLAIPLYYSLFIFPNDETMEKDIEQKQQEVERDIHEELAIRNTVPTLLGYELDKSFQEIPINAMLLLTQSEDKKLEYSIQGDIEIIELEAEYPLYQIPRYSLYSKEEYSELLDKLIEQGYYSKKEKEELMTIFTDQSYNPIDTNHEIFKQEAQKETKKDFKLPTTLISGIAVTIILAIARSIKRKRRQNQDPLDRW